MVISPAAFSSLWNEVETNQGSEKLGFFISDVQLHPLQVLLEAAIVVQSKKEEKI